MVARRDEVVARALGAGHRQYPKLVIDFYNERRKQLLAVKPNRGHKLVSEMEKFFNVTVITQNIDNLHERAGSSHIIHLHALFNTAQL